MIHFAPTRAVCLATALLLAVPLAAQSRRWGRAPGAVYRSAPAGGGLYWVQRGRPGGGGRAAPPNAGRPGLGGGLKELRQLTPEEQERALEADPRFQALPPAKQKAMLNRLQWFNSLPRDQQNRIATRLDHLGELTPQQRDGLEQIYKQWQTMTPDRRQAFHAAYNQLSKMPPDKRADLMSSPRFQQRYSPGEQQMLQQALDLNLPPDVVGSPPNARPNLPH